MGHVLSALRDPRVRSSGRCLWGAGQGGKAVAEGARGARGALKEGLHPGLEQREAMAMVCGASCCRPVEADCAYELSDLTLAV